MGKLLRIRDVLLLTLAGIGDVAQEIKDPMQIMGKSYEAMYGFIPNRYKRSNFLQMVRRNLKTGNIEKVIKNGEVYLRLTVRGTKNLHRDFPILNLTKKWDKRWVIVVFDISEKSKSIRNNLRNKLKSLGFGMLQKSIWISPLSIKEDMREFIDSIGLSEYVFVMEVSGFILGNPKELVRRVWNLDSLEKEFLDIKLKIEEINQLVRIESDRIKKREAKVISKYIYNLERRKREATREKLKFMVRFPPLPKQLLPTSLRNLFHIVHK